jgi:hypothetical protein
MAVTSGSVSFITALILFKFDPEHAVKKIATGRSFMMKKYLGIVITFGIRDLH